VVVAAGYQEVYFCHSLIPCLVKMFDILWLGYKIHRHMHSIIVLNSFEFHSVHGIREISILWWIFKHIFVVYIATLPVAQNKMLKGRMISG
jgi:hypothetical protein